MAIRSRRLKRGGLVKSDLSKLKSKVKKLELHIEELEKQLLIQRVSNRRELLLNFLDWYNEDAEKTPITEDEIDLFIDEKIK